MEFQVGSINSRPRNTTQLSQRYFQGVRMLRQPSPCKYSWIITKSTENDTSDIFGEKSNIYTERVEKNYRRDVGWSGEL